MLGCYPILGLVEIKMDKLGRPHVKVPCIGPVLVFNINAMFHNQTMEAHANDFLPLIKQSVIRGESCFICVVDNGPDMNPSNYVNEIYWDNLWKDSRADMIVCT